MNTLILKAPKEETESGNGREEPERSALPFETFNATTDKGHINCISLSSHGVKA